MIRSNIGVNALSAGVSRKPRPKVGVGDAQLGHGKCTARAVAVHAHSFYPRRTVQGRRATYS